jgi:hypothetical protein
MQDHNKRRTTIDLTAFAMDYADEQSDDEDTK